MSSNEYLPEHPAFTSPEITHARESAAVSSIRARAEADLQLQERQAKQAGKQAMRETVEPLISETPITSDNWKDSAPCKGMTDLFFSESEYHVAIAKAICAGCRVVSFCKPAADTGNAGKPEVAGIWAGENYYLTRQQRERLNEARRFKKPNNLS